MKYARSDIEDLAFTSRSSRVSGRAGLRVCIEQHYMLWVMLSKQLKTS